MMERNLTMLSEHKMQNRYALPLNCTLETYRISLTNVKNKQKQTNKEIKYKKLRNYL